MIGGASGVEAGTTDDESKQLRERFGDLGGRIHWLGRINNEELPTYINSARAFVLCSLIEGHPRVMIEAMACGMPIIGTNVPGISNVLQHEVTGYLCDTDADSIGCRYQDGPGAARSDAQDGRQRANRLPSRTTPCRC